MEYFANSGWPQRQQRGSRRNSAPVKVEHLESRRLLSATGTPAGGGRTDLAIGPLQVFTPGDDDCEDHSGLHAEPTTPVVQLVPGSSPVGAPIGALHALSSIPVLNSNPGASVQVYLDFDGHSESVWGSYSNITTPVFSIDSDFTTFSDQELAAITEVWQRVAEDFSPFNVNVTTVNPGSFPDGGALLVSIGGSGGWLGAQAGGVAYLNSFTSASFVNTVYVFSDNLALTARYIAEATSHETGHAFGLQHQSTYSGTTKTAEYSSGSGSAAPIMGVSYYATRTRWWNGQNSISSTTIQDDVAVIARSANGFGLRAPVYGQSLATATPLPISGGSATVSGVIASTSAADYFSFSTGTGAVTFSVSNSAVGPNLDATIELRNSSGTLIASATTSVSQATATISTTLTNGDYYVDVKSNGTYGSLGQYTLSGSSITTAVTRPAAPGNFTAVAASSSQVDLAWDAPGGQTGYRVYQFRNGAFVQIATLAGSATGYSVTGLTARTSYRFYVQAFNAGGATSSSQATVTTLLAPPTAPARLTATALSNSQVSLTWTNSVGQTGYRIFQFIGGSYVQIGTVSANTLRYNVSGLSSSTTAQFRVEAFNADSATASQAAFATTLVDPPAAPGSATATAVSDTRIDLAWSDPTGQTGFRVYQRNGSTLTLLATLGAGATSYSVNGLSARRGYQFIVQAFNAGGAAATPILMATTRLAPPTAPGSVSVTAVSNTQVSLAWMPAVGHSSYKVYQDQGGSFTLIATLASSARRYTVTALSPNTAYQFRVDASNIDYDTASPPISATTLVDPPEAPGSFTATAISNSQVDLAWTDPAGETGFRVYGRQGATVTLLATLSAGTTSYSVTGLTARTQYQFSVQAFNGGGTATTPLLRVVTKLAPATAPGNLTATAVSNSQVNLAWTASTGNTSYQIYQAQGAGFSLIATVSSRVTRFTVSGLSTTTAYQFRVDAVNADSTTPSQTASTTTLVDPPTQPSDLSATVLAGGQVQLDWTDSTGETGYRVYQRNGSASTLIGTVSAGVVTYTVRGLTPGNRYQFYVQAFNAGGVAASGTVTATANDIPTAVQSFTIAVRSNAVTLSWLDSARETSYEIYGDIGGSMALLTTRPANSRSTIVSGLTPSTTYQFYVRAVNALGATVSPTLTVTTDLVPPTNPGPLAVVAASSSQIDLTWSDASYAAGYKIFIRVGNGATTLLATVASGTTTFSATGLLASQRYAFSVQAYNVRGAISTAWQTVTTLAPGATLAPAA